MEKNLAQKTLVFKMLPDNQDLSISTEAEELIPSSPPEAARQPEIDRVEAEKFRSRRKRSYPINVGRRTHVVVELLVWPDHYRCYSWVRVSYERVSNDIFLLDKSVLLSNFSIVPSAIIPPPQLARRLLPPSLIELAGPQISFTHSAIVPLAVIRFPMDFFYES